MWAALRTDPKPHHHHPLLTGVSLTEVLCQFTAHAALLFPPASWNSNETLPAEILTSRLGWALSDLISLPASPVLPPLPFLLCLCLS